jgi:hypothetical protein
LRILRLCIEAYSAAYIYSVGLLASAVREAVEEAGVPYAIYNLWLLGHIHKATPWKNEDVLGFLDE